MPVNEKVGPTQMSRKARFKGALGLAGMTARQWALEHRVAEAHLHRVVAGKVVSAPLTAKVDAFIAKQFEEPPAPPTSATAA